MKSSGKYSRRAASALILSVLCATAVWAQQPIGADSIKALAGMNQEVGNRNVMLHAASANGPREISIGLPGGDVNVLENVFASNDGAMELQFDLQPGNAGRCGVELRNDKGEKTIVYIDADRQRIVMDRAESGITDFGKKVEPHHLDNAASLERYRTLTENYRNAFALGTP